MRPVLMCMVLALIAAVAAAPRPQHMFGESGHSQPPMRQPIPTHYMNQVVGQNGHGQRQQQHMFGENGHGQRQRQGAIGAEGYKWGPVAIAATAPSGSYTGSKDILGEKIQATVAINDATTMSFIVSGAVSVNCKSEAYTYDGSSTITLPNAGTVGDCVYEALHKNGASLTSITYESSSDEIKVKVKKIIEVTIDLSKSAVVGRNGHGQRQQQHMFGENGHGQRQRQGAIGAEGYKWGPVATAATTPLSHKFMFGGAGQRQSFPSKVHASKTKVHFARGQQVGSAVASLPPKEVIFASM